MKSIIAVLMLSFGLVSAVFACEEHEKNTDKSSEEKTQE